MNIKEKIGERILEARKAKGLTRKALAELTDDLKPSRINNWESGIRTPGPEEIKQLADALDLQPAYLMCLSDDKQLVNTDTIYVLIPLLDPTQATQAENYTSVQSPDHTTHAHLISVSTALLPQLSQHAFALKMPDNSMIPEFLMNDLLVIDPSVPPKPGDFVAVQVTGKMEAIICQYKKLSYTLSEFELLTLNDKWPNITVDESDQVKMIGKVVMNIRSY